MGRTSIAIVLICLFMITELGGQSLGLGILPKVTVTTKVGGALSLANSIESRQSMYMSDQMPTIDYQYILTDVISFLSYRIDPDQKVNAGYTLRFRGDQEFHRISQHYNLIRRYDKFRIGHRFAADQTFSSESSSEFRLRYRATFETAISGTKIDAREFYLKAGNEYLYSYKDGSSLEIRFIPIIGYQVDQLSKLETGLDYRIKSPFTDETSNDIWLRMTWYLSI